MKFSVFARLCALWLCLFGWGAECARGQAHLEALGRGVVALRTSSTQVYVGWRLLATDPENLTFNLYRSTGGAAAVKLNGAPLAVTTDYRDTPSSTDFAATLSYHVRPVVGGVEQAPSAPFVLPASAPIQAYHSIPLQIPAGGTTPDGVAYTYAANDAAPADLDGDGEYEIILKWDPSNAKDNSQSGYTGNVYLDAYRLDGTRLWRVDLGRNIRAGAHYTQFIAYDLDGDGRAELACKTAPGTLDGLGVPVLMAGDSVGADYRNSSGYILSGPEYLTVFDGLTGAQLATTAYLPGRGTVSDWGDSYGNRVDRFVAGVAYLDGQLPSLVMCRGYYTQTHLVAWDWRGGVLSRRWTFSAANGTAYAGQGNHQLSIADVDDDGRQEIIYGAMAVDDNGVGLHTTGLGHGDALHVSDFRPSRPGLEVFTPQEYAASNGNIGTTFRDARTGARIWTTYGAGDIGRGVMFDIDPRYPGGEGWATNNSNIYSAYGPIIAAKPSNMFHNFAVWWDADPERELLDGATISDWNYTAGGRSNYLAASGVSSNNSTKSTPCLSGDILGDWREEVVWRASDNTALRIYSTTIAATDRRVTFLHDPQYRVALAWQNVAYNQPPHPSFPVVAPPAYWTGATTAVWASGSATWSRLTPAAVASTLRAGDSAVLAPVAAMALSLSGAVGAHSLIVESAAEVTVTGPGTLTGAGTWNHAGSGVLRWSASGNYATWANVFAGRAVFSADALLTVPRLQVHAGGALGGPGRVAGTLELRDGSGLLADPDGPLRVTGDVVIPGTVTVSAAPGRVLSPGTYTVLTYTGTLTGAPVFAWSGAGLSAVFDTATSGVVRVTLAAATVIGPDEITWTGSAGAQWDYVAENWLGLGGITVFEDGDAVAFEGSPSVTALTLGVTVTPASVTIDSPANWTLSGAGVIAGAETTLHKYGAGKFTVATANTYAGGTRLVAGTLEAGHASAFGSGAIVLAGGTLATGTKTVTNALTIEADARITGGDGGGLHGIKTVAGSGVLTLEATNVFDLEGGMSGFTGRVVLGGSGTFRFFGGSGSANAEWDLGTRSLGARSGSTFALGSLTGAAGSSLNNISNNSSGTATYTVGALGRDSTFAGTIANGGTRLTALVKTGSGRLTLSGASTYTGSTTVAAGTLAVSGSLAATVVTVQADAAMAGVGSLGGALTLAAGSRLLTVAGEEALSVAGPVVLEGPVAVVAESDPFAIGSHVVLRYADALTGEESFTWTPPVGEALRGVFDFSVTGEVRLVVSSSLSPIQAWRVAHFGVSEADGVAADLADADADGAPNLLEYALARDPLNADALSAPALTRAEDGRLRLSFSRVADPALRYEVLGADALGGAWAVVWSSTGAANLPGVVVVSDLPEAAFRPQRFLRLRVTLTAP